MTATTTSDLNERAELLRSLHVPGEPLLLPNAWDAATAKAVADAGFPVVATTSGGISATLGYADHEGAPAEEMFAAAARIAGAVDLPVTVDAEAGYGIEPAELVASLREIGAAGCNLEDSDYTRGGLRDPDEQAEWLRSVRGAASEIGYRLVVNARIDVFLANAGEGSQSEHLPDAVQRARAYLNAGADCVFPITLWEADALARFIAESRGPVNVLPIPPAPPLPELARLGAARISWGALLHHQTMEEFSGTLAALAASAPRK